MTTPRLNRIFSVTGSSTRTERRPIEWGYNAVTPNNVPEALAGQWCPFLAGLSTIDDGALASEYAASVTAFDLYPESVGPGGAAQTGVPRIGDQFPVGNTQDDDHWVRLSKPGQNGYVQWAATSVRTLAGGFQTDGLVRVSVPGGAGQLVGDDFTIGYSDYVVFSFERHAADFPVTTTIDKRVWGELLERGSALGVIDVTTAQGNQVLTGSQEEGSATVRYDPGLGIGTMLVDDLARTWLIRGSRTLRDRRYLEFDLTRQVAGVA